MSRLPIAAEGLALFAMVMAAAVDARGERRAQGPILTIGQGGCRLHPALDAMVRRVLAKVPDGPPYKASEAVRFSFGRLHGIGITAEANDDFAGEALYFLEDPAALRRVLTGIGLHVDRNGDVVEAARFTEGGHAMVAVSVNASDWRERDAHFSAARSVLSCGAL
jgi:hypothetical protein